MSLFTALLGGAGGSPGSPGFLSTTTSTFAVTNYFLNSNDFTQASWGKFGVGAAAPTVTKNNVLDPDGNLLASTLSFPAVGAGQSSALYNAVDLGNSTLPYKIKYKIRGIVGGETIWLSSSATGVAGTFVRTQVTLTTAWQDLSLLLIGRAAHQFVELGVDTRDTGQSAQPAQSVAICQAQFIDSVYDWPYIPTTTAAVKSSQVLAIPSGTAFRDFSPLLPYAGNPIIAQNTGAYNVNGVTSDYFNRSVSVSGTFYSMGSGDAAGGAWNNIILYAGSGPLTMAPSGSNPIITHTAAAWDDHYLLHAKIVPIGGQFYAYYSAMDAGGNSSIGVAIASSITGPYTKYASNPIITGNFSLPHIVTIGSLLVMYTSVNNNGGDQIVYFTSPVADGLTWTFAGTALNSFAAGDWDATRSGIIDVFVFLNSRGFYEMAYTAEISGQEIGYAISKDGFKWYKLNAAPILTPNSTQSGASQTLVGDPVFDQDGTTFTMLWDDSNGSNIAVVKASQMADH